MEANDERWNRFVEAYGRLTKRLYELATLTNEIIDHAEWKQDVNVEAWRTKLEEIKNGEG